MFLPREVFFERHVESYELGRELMQQYFPNNEIKYIV